MKRFVHIPKTAGISVLHWLSDIPEPVLCGSSIITKDNIPPSRHHKRGWWKEKSEKFTIVRNPYHRCVSAYEYLIQENRRVPKDTSFEQFVKGYVINTQKDINTIYPQMWWFYVHGKKTIDKIIRFETLENELQSYFRIYKPLPKHNVSNIKDYNSYYNNTTKDLVYRFYRQDFKHFGYKK